MALYKEDLKETFEPLFISLIDSVFSLEQELRKQNDLIEDFILFHNKNKK